MSTPVTCKEYSNRMIRTATGRLARSYVVVYTASDLHYGANLTLYRTDHLLLNMDSRQLHTVIAFSLKYQKTAM
jgi:hypothetical protein